MPIIECPQCGRHSRADRRLIGRTVQCPDCHSNAVVQARFRDIVSAAHPAGLWSGRGLMALSVAAGAFVVWAIGHSPTSGVQSDVVVPGAYTTAALFFVGLALVWRHRAGIITHPH